MSLTSVQRRTESQRTPCHFSRLLTGPVSWVAAKFSSLPATISSAHFFSAPALLFTCNSAQGSSVHPTSPITPSRRSDGRVVGSGATVLSSLPPTPKTSQSSAREASSQVPQSKAASSMPTARPSSLHTQPPVLLPRRLSQTLLVQRSTAILHFLSSPAAPIFLLRTSSPKAMTCGQPTLSTAATLRFVMSPFIAVLTASTSIPAKA